MKNNCPPFKIEIEQNMLATLIQSPELLKKLPLKEEHFYHKNNLIAFQTLRKMDKEGEAINIVSFGGRFYDNGGKISEFSNLIDDYHSDLFAEMFLKQLAEETAKRKIWEKYQEMENAPREFIEEMKKIELDFINQRPKGMNELYKDYLQIYKKRKEKLQKKGAVGLITGFKKIDENCSFDEGNLIILAAKTSVGKTALALNIAINSAMFEQKILFFSAEMTINELMNRVLSQLTELSATRFKYCNADTFLPLAKNEIETCGDNLKFIEAGEMTSEDVCRIARQESLMKKPELIIVDYIQYLKDKIGKGNTNNDRIGNITRNLKGLAMELKCPILALSQVNRATTGAPELFNLRDSGNIEQDADIVLILHRERKEDIEAELIIAKNRNGQIKTDITLNFKPELTKFYE